MTVATTTSLGEIKLAGDLAGVNNGLAPELTASGVTAGAYVLPSITVDAKGRITVAANGTSGSVTALVPDASTTVKGIASINPSGNITLTSGAISIPIATSSVKGIASFSSDFTVTGGNVVINVANLPVATASVFGLVKSGTNITNTAGVLSVPTATSSILGIGSFNTNDFVVSAGAVSLNPGNLPTATGAAFGLVQSGSNITNTVGVLSIAVATGSVFGVVKSGTNITNTGGVFSVADATTAVKGVASFSSSHFTVTSGAVGLASSVVVSTTTQNTWTKAQSYSVVALTPGATVTPDFSLGIIFTLAAGQNFTLANPTNVVAGTSYLIIITQDATGGRVITWGANFKFGTGAIQTLSTAASKRDIVSIVALTSSVLLTTTQLGF